MAKQINLKFNSKYLKYSNYSNYKKNSNVLLEVLWEILITLDIKRLNQDHEILIFLKLGNQGDTLL